MRSKLEYLLEFQKGRKGVLDTTKPLGTTAAWATSTTITNLQPGICQSDESTYVRQRIWESGTIAILCRRVPTSSKLPTVR
jgi:hypothetical protein